METLTAQPREQSRPGVATAGPRARLRVALLAHEPLQPRWAVDAFARIEALEFAELVAVVLLHGTARNVPLLWQAYRRLDEWAFGLKLDRLQLLELNSQFPGSMHIACDVRDPQWRARLHALAVDVLFALDDVDDQSLQGVARYGVWRFCLGESGEHDSLAGIRELAGGSAVMASGVKATLRPDEPGRMLYQSWSRIFPYSLARTRDNLLPRATHFVERTLRMLHEGGESWMQNCAPVQSEPATVRRLDSEDLVTLASVLGFRLARAVQQRAYVQQWFLAYRFGGGLGGDRNWQGDFRNFTWMLPPKDRFWADPFPLEREGRHWIFFEELLFARGRAHISVVEVSPNGLQGAPVKVLERAYHLSYPFLVEHEGELFMIPETGENHSIEIYRCKRFPDEWTLEAELLRGSFFTDATVHRAGGRWWLFTNVSAAGTQGSDELNIYHAETLFGPWRPHRLNPVKCDVRGARPAGRLYEVDGRLYRPGQIGAPIYGAGVAINEVLTLTPQEYREIEVQRVVPSHPKEILGIHTLNRSGTLTVVDGFTRRPRIWS